MSKRFASSIALLASALAIPAAAQEPAPVVTPAQQAPLALPGETPEPVTTQQVILQTTLGDIVIAVETTRAPISAANFLRYVDEHRLDGTLFYRAMRLDWGNQPNGLIQAGTQYDSRRTLPPIAHEPTSTTGLHHLRGSLSLARYAPGTATGDFSILLQDMPGLDADPGNADPELAAGYAVFGRVIAGMEIVEAIHAAPTDPLKGEGFMRGQMLADPVKILSAKRVAQ